MKKRSELKPFDDAALFAEVEYIADRLGRSPEFVLFHLDEGGLEAVFEAAYS